MPYSAVCSCNYLISKWLYMKQSIGESQEALELLLRHSSRPYQVNRFGENLLMIAVSKNSALSNWLLKFEKEHLKTIPSLYQAHKNHAGETADDYKVKSFTFSKAEPRTDQ